MAPSAARPMGRPRDEAVDAAVLSATQDLLLEQGFDRVSVDAVAARAGVGKATIYRRWPGKTAVVVAAVSALTQVPPLPDTGSLREDLLACARTFIRTDRNQRILASLMTAMVHQDELRAAARAAIGGPFAELFRTVIDRAVYRQLAPAGVDISMITDLFPALAFHRSTALGAAVDETFAVRVVDHILLPLLT